MFVSSDQQCAGLPNSTDPASSAAVAATTAANTSLVERVLANANNDWLGLLSRSWQSYACFGPHVAIQLLNGEPVINAASQAKGIVVTDPSGPPQLTPDDISFAQYFGTNPEFQTYTGPLPPHGTARSLTMGGSNRALPVGPGRYPAATPERRFGTAPQCMSIPGSIASSIASGDGSMIAAGIIGLLALAGLGYAANHMEKKHGRGRF